MVKQTFLTVETLFKRQRRCGDIVFCSVYLMISVLLLLQIGNQTKWFPGTALFAQPAFWPCVSLVLMVVFAIFNLLGSAVSKRIQGRWQEVLFWFRTLEFVVWFLVYVVLVPQIGYLPATILFCVSLSLRAGYRQVKNILWLVVFGIAVVIFFKALLHVNIPGGAVYEFLPTALRKFALTYL